MLLQQFDVLPDGVLSATPKTLHQLIPEPALFHLPGKNRQPLFISVMQHGNEPTGFLAMQALLNKYQNKILPRAISLFFGNTGAAAQGLRKLPGQPDFNRVWPGTGITDCAEAQIAREIVQVMHQRHPFASIDIHNNTGVNPHYACINKLDIHFLQLACLYGRMIVFFTHPKGVQSLAFSEFCPAVTLECGRPGQQYGVEHALEFIDCCLHLSEISDHELSKQQYDLYHTVAQVTITENTRFSFHDQQTDLLLTDDLERMNFTEMPAGTVFGEVASNKSLPLLARNELGQDVTDNYFKIFDNQLQLVKSTMPSMLTLDERVIDQDCLCYLMERISL